MREEKDTQINIVQNEKRKKTTDAQSAGKEKKQTQVETCKYEDEGSCRLGVKCPNFHPKKTCQFLGKLGSCPDRKNCQLRHPRNVCFFLEKQGSCHRGDNCRFRHPLELLRKPFLGQRQVPIQFQQPPPVLPFQKPPPILPFQQPSTVLPIQQQNHQPQSIVMQKKENMWRGKVWQNNVVPNSANQLNLDIYPNLPPVNRPESSMFFQNGRTKSL